MTSFGAQPGDRLQGEVSVPGGESTSRRAPLLPDRRRKLSRFRVKTGGCVQNEATVPGGKSTSHRAVMLTAITEGI